MTAVLDPPAYLAPGECSLLYDAPLRRWRVEAELEKFRASAKHKQFKPKRQPYLVSCDHVPGCLPTTRLWPPGRLSGWLWKKRTGELDRAWHVPLPDELRLFNIDRDAGKRPEFVPAGVCRIEGCENLPTPQRRRCSACQTWISRNKANDAIREAWLADQKRRTMLPQTEKRRPKWERLTGDPDKYADQSRRRPHRRKDETPQPIPLFVPIYPPISVYVRADFEQPGEPGSQPGGLPALDYAAIVWNDLRMERHTRHV